MKKIVIIGDSGHAKVVADIVQSYEERTVIAKLDDRYTEVFSENGVVKGPINHLHTLIEKEPNLGVIIGIGSNAVRKKIVSLLALPDEVYTSVIHKSAVISSNSSIGVGTVVMPGAIINADAYIGNHVIINSGSVVEHDSTVMDYAHVSPCAALTGGVQIGEGAHVGTGASIIPQCKVESWATIGAGAVVVSDVDERTTVVGVPARVIKREGL